MNSETSFYINPASFVSDQSIGLYDGAIGNAILLFLLSGSSGDGVYKEMALKLLDSVGNRIAAIQSTSFSDGLSGIGWGIEWIAQNDFLEIDTDEVLEEMDDFIYKSAIYSLTDDLSLATGILGAITYFHSRYTSKNRHSHIYKNIFFGGIGTVLVNRILDKGKYPDLISASKKYEEGELVTIGLVGVFLSHLLKIVSNNKKSPLEQALYDITGFIHKFLEQNTGNETGNETNGHKDVFLFLASCYYLCGRNHDLNIWQVRGISFIKEFQQKATSVKYKISKSIFLADLILQQPTETDLNDDEMPICLTSVTGKKIIQDVALQNKINFDTAVSLLLLR